jgi:DNA polymerase III sliding clamp (beta) subunit (PCNA family)
MPGVIVPRKTVGELRKLLEDDEAEIAVSVSETKIRFATPEITLTSKVIDGTFPDYSRVIPAGNTRRMEVDASEFAKAVDRVATVSSERSRAVKMQLDEDRLILSVNAPDAARPRKNWPWPMATTSWRSASTRNTCWKSPARWIARTRCSCSPPRRNRR